jgi:hypothetical protein
LETIFQFFSAPQKTYLVVLVVHDFHRDYVNTVHLVGVLQFLEHPPRLNNIRNKKILVFFLHLCFDKEFKQGMVVTVGVSSNSSCPWHAVATQRLKFLRRKTSARAIPTFRSVLRHSRTNQYTHFRAFTPAVLTF